MKSQNQALVFQPQAQLGMALKVATSMIVLLAIAVSVQAQNIGGAAPQFGGFTPNAGATFRINRVGPNGGGFSLGLNLAQGRTRSSTTIAPSITTQNGFGGSIFSGQVRPFVTGVVPIVGSGLPPGVSEVVPPDNAVTRALSSGQLHLGGTSEPTVRQSTSATGNFSVENSSAAHGDTSVKQIKAQRQKMLRAKQQRLESALEKASRLESEKNYSQARSAYREALRHTDDQSVEFKIKSLIQATRQK